MRLDRDQKTRVMTVLANRMEKNDRAALVEGFVRDAKTVELLGEGIAKRVGCETCSQKEFLDAFFPQGGAARKAARDMIRRLRKGAPNKHSKLKAHALCGIFYHVSEYSEIPKLEQLGYPQGSSLYVVASNTLGDVKAAVASAQKSALR